MKSHIKLFPFLVHPLSIAALVCLIIQQLIVASSSFWIVSLIEDIQLGKNFQFSLALLLSSLILPYFPGALSFILLNKWKYNLTLSFTKLFVEKTKSNQALWSNKEAKEERLSILSNEGINTISTFSDYIYHLVATSTNVMFNVVALSILITYEITLGYLASLFLAALLMKLQKKKQEVLCGKAQQSRITLTQILLGSWDNVVLGNAYNFSLWNREAEKRSDEYMKSNFQSDVFNQAISLTLAFLTFIPSFFVVVQMLMKNTSQALILGAITVVLPRLFSILNYTYEVLALVTNWTSQKSRLVKIKTILDRMTLVEPLESRVSWEKLQCSYFSKANQENKSTSIGSIQELINKAAFPCRITIRGENGTGKSTIFLLIKEALKDEAFFLPVRHQLIFKTSLGNFSTGQGMKQVLHEIKNSVKEKVILLDEWDANLDHVNKEEISSIIDDLSQEKCVIEIRHH